MTAIIQESKKDEYEFFVDGTVYNNGKPYTEPCSYEQKCWVLFRLRHSNTWPKVHENKIGDWRNWK